MINSFNNEYFFLSNFYPNDRTSLEHKYQAAKCIDEQERNWIINSAYPGQAKKRGRQIKCRLDWDEEKVGIMRSLVWEKFQDPELKQKLLDTGNEELVEGNNWHDKFWGSVQMFGLWVGENWLGKILMETREKLRQQ